MTHLLVLTPITAPYRVPVFNELARLPDTDLRVVYLAERDPSRAWPTYFERMRFSHRVLRERWRIRWGSVWLHLSSGLFVELWRARGGVVIVGGWDQPLHHVALRLRRLLGYEVGCWVESTARDDRGGSRMLQWVKRRFLAACRVVVVPGRASAAYVSELGVPATRIVSAPNAVDADVFRRAAIDRRGRPGPPVVLFVGKLDAVKGLDVLLDAWRRRSVAAGILAVAGAGPLQPEVEALERTRGDVEYLGHLDEAALVAAYARADVFVFPSRSDPWGLVLNEALTARLPVITTPAPGAVDDLVEHADNGFVVPVGDAAELASAIDTLLEDGALRHRMGERGAARAAEFTPRHCAAGLRAAAALAAGR